MIIEQGQPRDIAFIADAQVKMAHETEHMLLDAATVRKGVQYMFDDPLRGFYVVARPDVDHEPVGCMLVLKEWSDWRNGDVWWLHSVYVVPEYRRQGVFRRMFDYIEREARLAHIRGIRLYVDKRNTRARTVYRQLGMTNEHYEMFEKMLDGSGG